jgi:hypothetical protein
VVVDGSLKALYTPTKKGRSNEETKILKGSVETDERD